MTIWTHIFGNVWFRGDSSAALAYAAALVDWPHPWEGRHARTQLALCGR